MMLQGCCKRSEECRHENNGREGHEGHEEVSGMQLGVLIAMCFEWDGTQFMLFWGKKHGSDSPPNSCKSCMLDVSMIM